MATFNTVWSVDLGKASLKAVKIRREANNLEILAVDKIDYPVGANGIDVVQQAREALDVFKIRNDVREPVVVAHPGQGTFSRFIKVPAFDAKKLKEMVVHEASQQIPFPLDEVIWDYHVINRDYIAGEEREIGIFAVRKEAIDDYLLDFTSNGLSVEMLSIGYLGLMNYVFYDLSPKEPSIILDIGATHTDLILVDGKKFWIRPLPQSGNDINKAIMDHFKLSFQEAEKLKIEASKAPQLAASIRIATAIQPKLKDLVGEIHRSSGYYRSQAGDVKFQNLFLMGGGSKIVGIKKFLTERLGLQVHRIQTIKHFRVGRDVNLKLLQDELPSFGIALGGALQGVGSGTCKVDLVPQEERIQKDLRRTKKHAFIAMGIIFGAIVWAGVVMSNRIERALSFQTENNDWLTKNVTKFDPSAKMAAKMAAKKGAKGAPAVSAKDDSEAKFALELVNLEQVAEARESAQKLLRSLGAVLPKENAGLIAKAQVEKGPGVAEAEKKVAEETKEQANKKVLLPYLHVERINWSKDAQAGTAGAGAIDAAAKKKVPTVPAYKVKVLAAVRKQATQEDSQALLRKLFVDPLKKALKDGMENKEDPLTIDAEVEESPEFIELKRLSWTPTATERGDREGAGAAGRSREKGTQDLDSPQEAGDFFCMQVSWIIRLKEPKDEVVEKKVDDITKPKPKPK